MTILESLLNGVVIGVSVAAPIGPNGLLCIQRTLVRGPLAGFVSGLGAATTHMVFSAIASLGLSALADVLAAQCWLLLIVGGTYLCYLGIKSFRSKPAASAAGEVRERLLGLYSSSLLLTFINPLTIMKFLALFIGAGVTVKASTADALMAPVGVFSGSALWWLALSIAVCLLRSQLTPGA